MRRLHTFIAIVGFGVLVPVAITYYIWHGGKEHGINVRSKQYPVEFMTGFTETFKKTNSRPSEADVRTFHMEKYCYKLRKQLQEERVKISQFKYILYDDRYKTLFCQIPKVASTNWRRMFLILSGKMNTTDPGQLKSFDVHKTYDKHIKVLGDLNPEQIRYRLKNYFKFVIVREPFERLLSAYRNKFGNLSKSNLYFHKRFGRRIVKKYRPNAKEQSLITGSDVTFGEFVQYILDPNRKEPLNEHWTEYHKLCLPCIVHYDYIGKYETLTEDSAAIIDRMRASDVIEFPERSATYHHKKTENYLYDYFKHLSPKTMLKLWKFYYPDFLLFNYTLPKSLHNLTNLANYL
ncbi:hypothetical protein SNE40_014072 [Patella caerulea]|uniref:Carbohydrate sulfotransferase n=2 Tax=Patella caerulea TaxID=87958 RepID=A0AAN8JCX0_PATCE